MSARSNLAASLALTLGGGACGAFAYVVFTQSNDNSWLVAFTVASLLVALCLISVSISELISAVEQKSISGTSLDTSGIVLASILNNKSTEKEVINNISFTLGDLEALRYIRYVHNNSLEEARVVLTAAKKEGILGDQNL